jgi:hypothetical protein
MNWFVLPKRMVSIHQKLFGSASKPEGRLPELNRSHIFCARALTNSATQRVRNEERRVENEE